MKKTIMLGTALLILLTVFAACGDPDNSTPSLGLLSGDGETGLKVQYIRTNGYSDGVAYPIITVVSSKNELDSYYEINRDRYDFSSRPIVFSDSTIGFIDAIGKYTPDFFADSFLVLVLLEEGSGSFRHKVERIDASGDIFISRLLPEISTDDMAEWHIIIELPKRITPRQFRVVFADISVS